MNWWRAYHDLPNDPKLALVAQALHGVTWRYSNGNAVRRGEVLEVWVFVLNLASEHNPRGSIEGYDSEQIGYVLEMEPERVEAIIEGFRQRGMIAGNLLTNWDKRQPKREREDDSGERVKDFRARTAQLDGVTPCNAKNHVTPCNAQIRGEEIREEETKKPRKKQKSSEMTVQQSTWFTDFLNVHPKPEIQTASAKRLWAEKVKTDECRTFLMNCLKQECVGDTTYMHGPGKWLADHLELYASGITKIPASSVRSEPILLFK